MTRASWFLLPLSAVLAAPLACSSSEANPRVTPPPPMGGSAGSPSGGAGGAGGAEAQGGSAGDASSGSGGGGDGTCKTADCPTGGFCRMGMCACPADKADICMGANVGGGANGLCTSKMADPDNCGECGMKCEAGAACVAGVCGEPPTDMVTSDGCGSMRLVIQGANIYWTESMSGKVRAAPLAGGAAIDVATAQLNPTQIAADDDGIYWVNQGDATAGTSKVMKKALSGAGAPVELAASPDAVKLLALAVGGGMVYFAHGNDVLAVPTTNDEDGEDPVVVATATNFDLNPPDGMPSGEPAGLVVSGTKLFWTTATRQGVEGDGTAPGLDAYVELGESQGNLLHQDIATDGTNAYWVDGAKIQRAPVKPPVQVTSTPDFDDIAAFAINANDVYFVTANGKLYKHGINPPANPDDAVPPTLLARDQAMSNSIVLDATKAYWSSACTIRSSGL